MLDGHVGKLPLQGHSHAFGDVVGVSERVERHRIDPREIWIRFFEEKLTRNLGEDFVPPGGYGSAATGFVGALIALVHQWSVTHPRGDLAAVTDVLTSFLMGLTRS
ncbi:hypothetical protein [Nocardia vulneris]|uniref:hypothetical protein n=1 Tax=Nocardia vulneris TaxID=1141657 RepID=UPI0006904477|nr:hypothetical protein [Nocardia vulneris]